MRQLPGQLYINYCIAVVLPGLAVASTKLIEPSLNGTVFPLTYAAVVAVALTCGLGPGLVAVAVGAIGLKLFLLPPLYSIIEYELSSILRLLLFLVLSLPLVWLVASLRAAYRRLQVAYAKAHQATLQRDHVLAVVSHDLRNPLAVLIGEIDVLSLRGPERGPIEHQARMDRLRRQGKLMERLISDLLDMASIDAGHLAIERRPQDACALAVDACDRLAPLAQTRRLTIRAECEERPMEILCDGDRVLQVLFNLLGNAIKFAPEGSEIALSARKFEDEICFKVSDKGPGIRPNDAPHLFERYWKANKADPNGVGLGLWISKTIIEAHGGRIWVESQPGSGADFLFTLPRAAGHV